MSALTIRLRSPWLLSVLVLGLVSAAPAQYAPGLNGQNGIFSVPVTTLGERGRVAISAGGAYSLTPDSSGIIALNISLNPFRNIGIIGGITFDSRPGNQKIRQQLHLGFRALLFNWLQRTWYNVGFEADALENRALNVDGVPFYFGNARGLATITPFPWILFTGYAGYATGYQRIGGLLTASRTLVRGGGMSIRTLPFVSLIGEYSNGFDPMDPGTNVVLGGLRIFPSSSMSFTAGYGRRWRDGGPQEPMVVGFVSISGGALDYLGPQPRAELIQAPDFLSASDTRVTSSIDSSRALPVSMGAFATAVQGDRFVTHVLATVRPRAVAHIFDALDSTAFRGEILRLNGDTTRVLQLTGTENASTEGDTARIAARSQVISIARSVGFQVSRISFRDQYASHRSAEPPAYAFFESRSRGVSYQSIATVAPGEVQKSVDSLSALVGSNLSFTKFRLTLESERQEPAELSAVYALQDALYSQSVCPSYSIEITFRQTRGQPVVRIEGAP